MYGGLFQVLRFPKLSVSFCHFFVAVKTWLYDNLNFNLSIELYGTSACLKVIVFEFTSIFYFFIVLMNFRSIVKRQTSLNVDCWKTYIHKTTIAPYLLLSCNEVTLDFLLGEFSMLYHHFSLTDSSKLYPRAI
jgi:hypothetical protein